jgi:transcriptional regulator with XRE-family HTH domain
MSCHKRKKTLKEIIQSKKAKVTQERLAELTGYSQSQISRVINGQRNSPELERLIRNAIA